MLLKPASLAVACTLPLLLAACGESEPQAAPTPEAVEATPGAAPGVSQEEADTRQAFSELGTAARSLVDAADMEAARDALGTVEERLSAEKKTLPADIATALEADLQTARDAATTDNLPAVKAAGQAMIDRILGSAEAQNSTLIRP